jgi:hypothetical protein
MNIEIKIRRNQHGKPADKLEDADTSAVVSSRGSSWLALRFRNGARALVQASPSSCTRRARATGAARRRWPRVAGAGPGAHSESGRVSLEADEPEANKRVIRLRAGGHWERGADRHWTQPHRPN